WGLGHEVTIVVVGGAIILFGLVIPPHIGLGMEFSVAIMLILLGILTLTGVTRQVQEARTGASQAEAHEAGHAHAHRHGDYVHSHVHGHTPERHRHAQPA